MPFYNDLRPQSDYKQRDYSLVFPGMTTCEKIRTITNLIRLKSGLEQHVPSRKAYSRLFVKKNKYFEVATQVFRGRNRCRRKWCRRRFQPVRFCLQARRAHAV